MIIKDTKTNATVEISAVGFAVYRHLDEGDCLDPRWLDVLMRYTAPDGRVAQGFDPAVEVWNNEAAQLCAFFANTAALAVGESSFCVLLDNTIILSAERLGAKTWLLDAEARYYENRSERSFRAVQTDVTRLQLKRMEAEWAYVQWKYCYPAEGSGWVPTIGPHGGHRTSVYPPVPSREEEAARRFDEAEFVRFGRIYRWRISPDGDLTVTP